MAGTALGHDGWQLNRQVVDAGLQLDRDPAELGRHPRRVELYLEEIVLGGDRDQAIGVLAVVEAVLEPSQARSEERRVGEECVSTCRSRWWPYHLKHKHYS